MSKVKVSQVKGSMLVTFVKAIKADKTGACEKLLTDEDKKIISTLILASKWYPFETYKNCFKAVCQVNAGNGPDVLREWGRMAGETTMTTIYKTVLNKKDAESALGAFQQIVKNVYDSITIEKKMASDNEIIITITDFDPDFEQWYLVGLGWIERTIELVIKKAVKSQIIERSWQGAPATVFKMSWS